MKSSFAGCVLHPVSTLKTFFSFLCTVTLLLNFMADEQADELSACIAEDGDYGGAEDGFPLSGILLLMSFIVAALVTVVLGYMYYSLATYYSVGTILPYFEYILGMSNHARVSCMLFSVLPGSILFLYCFHYARHAGWRIIS